MNKAEQYLKNLNDEELTGLVAELERAVFNEGSSLRKAVNEIFPEVGIFVLRVNELIYPLLKEVTERFKLSKN